MAHIITKPRCAVCSVWKVWIQFFDMFAIFDFQFFPFSIFSILNLLDHSMRIIKKDFFHFIFCWFFNSFPAIKCSLSLFFSYKIPTNYFKFWLNQKCNCLQILRGLFRFLYQSNLWLCFRVGVFFFFFSKWNALRNLFANFNMNLFIAQTHKNATLFCGKGILHRKSERETNHQTTLKYLPVASCHWQTN